MNASPFRRTSSHSGRFRVSPLALSLLVLPLGAPLAHAQLQHDDTNQPAAVPPDKPRGLQTPDGPIIGAPGNAPPVDAQNNSTVLGATDQTTTPELPPIVGDVAGAEGRDITEVRVVGNRVIPTDTILTQIRIQRSSAFSARQVALDQSRIFQLGYFASVQPQVSPDVNDPEKVTLTYIVVENRVVTGFSFVGNTLIKPEELQKAVVSKTGILLNNLNVKADVEAIKDVYKNKGFAVLPIGARQEPNGTITYTLLEAKLTQVKLSGLRKTSPTLVRKLIVSPVNEPFDFSKINRDRSRLLDTGFFEDVQPNFEDDPDPNVRGGIILTFLFKEKRTGQFGVGLGFDSRSRISGFVSVGETNFRGSGKRIAASLEAGSRRNYNLSYGNPFVGKKNGSYDISIYQTTIYRQPQIFSGIGGVDSTLTFEEQRTGGRINVALPIDQQRTKSFIFGLRNERAKLRQTDNNGVIIDLPQFSSGTILAPSIGFIRDRRDSRIDPSRGGRELVTIEQGLKFIGGSSSFTKLDIDLRRYLPLSKPKTATDLPKIVLAGRVVLGRSLNQLPTFEQYFLGGPDTVRGYQTDFQYGDNQFYGNAELRYRFNKTVQGVLFSDAGSAFGGNFTTNSSVNLLYSVGLGVRLQTPIGPVRLDYGFGKEGGRTHFAIGPTF